MRKNSRNSYLLSDGRRVVVSDLLEAGLLFADQILEFVRPRLGQQYIATVTADGKIRCR